MTTFVLVHGSYQGGWIWQRVATRLRSAGHTVYAPTMDGCAERRHQLRPGIDTSTYVAEIADLLFYEDLHDVVLVGTSSGGMVVCGAAEKMRHRVARLVLVDALALFNGERTRDIVKRTTAGPAGARLCAAARGRREGIVRRSGSGDAGLGARPLYPASDRMLGDPGEADRFLGPELEGHRDLVPPGAQSGRGASAPCRRSPWGQVAGTRHRTLSDAQHAG